MTELPSQCPQCGSESNPPVGERQAVRYCSVCRLPQLIVAGKYRLERMLCEGGCGMLYLARHQRLHMDPIRVVKFIRPELCRDERIVKRLAQEVEVTAALSQKNEHIVRVYDDFGQSVSLGHYYVMEYLQGLELHEYLEQQGFLSVLEAIHLFEQICLALRDAHRYGVIHRDLKPQNIFLIERAENSQFVKVIDFGIAKTLFPSQTDDTQETMGTPEYMSPEQCNRGPVDHRTDIYAMGILLYQMLVGHTPFLPPHKKGSIQLMHVLVSHLVETPVKPSEANPNSDIPDVIDAFVLKALEKDPNHRFQSVDEMLAQLRYLAKDLLPADLTQQVQAIPSNEADETLLTWQEHQKEHTRPDATVPSIEAIAAVSEPSFLATGELAHSTESTASLTPVDTAPDVSQHRLGPTTQPDPFYVEVPDHPVPVRSSAAWQQVPYSLPSDNVITVDVSNPSKGFPVSTVKIPPPPGRGMRLLGWLFVVFCCVGFVLWQPWKISSKLPPPPVQKKVVATTQRPKPVARIRVPNTKSREVAVVPRSLRDPVVTTPPADVRTSKTKLAKVSRVRARTRRSIGRRTRHRMVRRSLPARRRRRMVRKRSGCPSDSAKGQWIRVDLRPKGTQVRSPYQRRSYAPSWVCLLRKKGQKRALLTFQLDGYHDCIVRLPTNQRRLRVKLVKASHDSIAPTLHYCVLN